MTMHSKVKVQFGIKYCSISEVGINPLHIAMESPCHVILSIPWIPYIPGTVLFHRVPFHSRFQYPSNVQVLLLISTPSVHRIDTLTCTTLFLCSLPAFHCGQVKAAVEVCWFYVSC